MDFDDLGRIWREEGSGDYKRARVEDLTSARDRARNHVDGEVRIGLISLGLLLIVCVPLF